MTSGFHWITFSALTLDTAVNVRGDIDPAGDSHIGPNNGQVELMVLITPADRI